MRQGALILKPRDMDELLEVEESIFLEFEKGIQLTLSNSIFKENWISIEYGSVWNSGESP